VEIDFGEIWIKSFAFILFKNAEYQITAIEHALRRKDISGP